MSFLLIFVMGILCQMRVVVIMAAAMWVRAVSNSPFSMMIIEYLYNECKDHWKTYSTSIVPLRFQPYLLPASDTFSEDCDFLPSDEDISINLNHQLHLNFINAGKGVLSKRSPRFQESSFSKNSSK